MRTTKRRVKMLAGALGACAASALLGAGTAGAGADPTITLEHGYLKVSGPGGSPAPSKIVDDDPVGGLNPVVLTVSYTVGASGDFTLDEEVATNFSFPAYQGELATDYGTIPTTLDFEPIPTAAGDITGNYNAATGTVSFAGDPVKYKATVTFSILGTPATCEMQPITLGLSTATTAPFAGDLFESGPPPANGAIVAGWSALPAPVALIPAQQDYCTLLGSVTSGCGGTWLSNGSVTGPPAVVAQPGCEKPAATTPVTKKKCKKGRKLRKGKCVKKKRKKKKK